MHRCLALLLLSACHPESKAPDPDPAGSDSSEPGTWVEIDFALPEHWSGLISVWTAGDVGQPLEWYLAAAEFLEPGPNATLRSKAIIEDAQDGLEDCGRMRLTGQVVPTTFPERAPLDAGRVTLTAPDGTEISLERYDSGLSANLGGEGLEPVVGPHRFSAAGADLPAFEVEVNLLPELQLEAPDPTEGLPLGETEVRWTGTSDGTVGFEIGVLDEELGAAVIVSCEWEDDGSATLPASVVEGLPANGLVTWRMIRLKTVEFELSDGSVLGGQSSARLDYLGF